MHKNIGGILSKRVYQEGELVGYDCQDLSRAREKEEVRESAASSDLQEITTTLTVHFNIVPSSAWEVYQTMRQDYHDLLLRPVIQARARHVGFPQRISLQGSLTQ